MKWVRSDYISIHGELAYRQVAPEATGRCLHEGAVLWYSRRSYEAHTRPGPITTTPRASNRQTSPVAKISRPLPWSEKWMFMVFCGLSGSCPSDVNNDVRCPTCGYCTRNVTLCWPSRAYIDFVSGVWKSELLKEGLQWLKCPTDDEVNEMMEKGKTEFFFYCNVLILKKLWPLEKRVEVSK
jgi:hypothetical protein